MFEYGQFTKKNLFATEKTSAILLNLQSMISSIDDSKQTAEVLATYQLASNTLRQSYSDSGITADKVDDVLADVQEVSFLSRS